MADTQTPKSGKAKSEEPAATPSAGKRPSKASTAREGSARPAAAVERRVKEETVPVKSAAKPRTGIKKSASDAARSSGKTTALPDPQETYRMIAEAAYYLAEKRNFAPGWEQQDWEAARQDVMARLAKRNA